VRNPRQGSSAYGISGRPASEAAAEGYGIFLRDSGTLRLRRYDSGNDTTDLFNTAISLTDGDWIDVEVEWTTGGSHNVTAYTVDQSTGDRTGVDATASASDGTYTGEGVWFFNEGGGGSEGYVDHLRIV